MAYKPVFSEGQLQCRGRCRMWKKYPEAFHRADLIGTRKHYVCRECRNARDRENRKLKRRGHDSANTTLGYRILAVADEVQSLTRTIAKLQEFLRASAIEMDQASGNPRVYVAYDVAGHVIGLRNTERAAQHAVNAHRVEAWRVLSEDDKFQRHGGNRRLDRPDMLQNFFG